MSRSDLFADQYTTTRQQILRGMHKPRKAGRIRCLIKRTAVIAISIFLILNGLAYSSRFFKFEPATGKVHNACYRVMT